MSPAPSRPATLLATLTLALSWGAVAGCGGSDDPSGAATPQAAGRAYATQVAAVTQRTSARLAQFAATSDYKTAAAAKTSTQAYATAIRTAADDLAQAKAPAVVAGRHAALVALYRTTADRMDALATKFGAADGVGALATQAQAFSVEVQRYSTREAQLRAAIESALTAQASPPVVGTTPGVQGTSDPG